MPAGGDDCALQLWQHFFMPRMERWALPGMATAAYFIPFLHQHCLPPDWRFSCRSTEPTEAADTALFPLLW